MLIPNDGQVVVTPVEQESKSPGGLELVGPIDEAMRHCTVLALPRGNTSFLAVGDRVLIEADAGLAVPEAIARTKCGYPTVLVVTIREVLAKLPV